MERLLEDAGLSAKVRAVRVSPARSRRRATFSGRRTKKTVQLGYMAKASDTLVDINACPLVTPAIEAALPELRALVPVAASRRGVVRFMVTETDTGLDLAISGAREVGPEALAQLGRGPWARVAWNGEDCLLARAPVVRLGGVEVRLPAEAFLQATGDGEAALQAKVLEALGAVLEGPGPVADLFCGCGTFALPLSKHVPVAAFDAGAEMVAALDEGWRRGTGLKPLRALKRDLFRRPVLAQELARVAGVVLDPPRAGAAAQVAELAKSAVPVIAYVSCDPASFARDARALCAAGFRLDWVDVVDQFRWSAHVEIAASFRRG